MNEAFTGFSTEYPAAPRLRALIAKAQARGPIRAAVVEPTDALSVGGALAAGSAGLIHPIFVGRRSDIERAMGETGLPREGFTIVNVHEVHEAAEAAVALVRSGKVDALVKGALHTDTFMHPIVRELRRSDESRMSHVALAEIPAQDRLLILSDGAINIAPNLETKRDIVQNAIDVAHAVGIEHPRVAILAAVETVSSAIEATVHAAALCKMAERGQISGGVLDGPLAFDDAISPRAARQKGLTSSVAGVADVLIAPDLESANMLFKELEYFGDAACAEIVVGACVPVVLTSRADSVFARVASIALAVLTRSS
jgi:phosphate acetyltransferase/phosphate butyryltransferase